LPVDFGIGGAGVLETYDWEGVAAATVQETITRTVDPADADRVTQRVVMGQAAPVLIDASHGAALLVVGSRGRGGFAGLLLGSTSQHVIARAACPVVVVRAPESDAG